MSDERKDGGPAFPAAIAITEAGDVYHGYDGMTLRDWFAGQAILTAYNDLRADERDETRRTLNSGKELLPFSDVYTHPDHIAEVAYDIADSMIVERNRVKP